MAYHVYILVNPDGKTYVGQTSDLARRVAQHNHPDVPGTLHTKRHRGPWRLLHAEQRGITGTATLIILSHLTHWTSALAAFLPADRQRPQSAAHHFRRVRNHNPC